MKGLSEKGGAERSLVALGASDAAFAWSELLPGSRVIDVGGGEGHLLAQILTNHPHLVGTCVDRPDVAARASAYLSNVAGAEAVAGSFSTACPPATSTCSSGSCTTGMIMTRCEYLGRSGNP